MQDLPFAQLLLLIAFILFPLLNLLFRRMQRRVESQTPRDEQVRQGPRRMRTIPPPPEVTAPARERIRPADLPEPPQPRRSHSSKRSFFRTRRDLRQAIILMTVLGPCRAADPPETQRRAF
ncbi:MAG: hypothetical protein ACREQ7_09280 [Candidatus Binatia bacterium]